MPRPKKAVARKTQVFELDGDVKVTVEFPAGRVRWQATHNSLSIATGDAELSALSLKPEKNVPVPSGEPVPQESDAIRALRAQLPADPLSGGLPKQETRVIPTSADNFRALGMDFDDSELSPEALESMATFGGAAV